MNAILGSHFIPADMLRSDDFATFYQTPQVRHFEREKLGIFHYNQ